MNLNNPIGYKSTEPLQKPFIMNPFRFGGGDVGSWKEVGRNILTGTNGTLDSGTFTAKKYLQVLVYLNNTSAVEQRMRFNSVSASEYAFRFSSDGGTDGTAINDSNMLIGNGGITTPSFTNININNNTANEKLSISNNVYQNTAGAGTAPQRFEAVNKWANTSSDITSIQLFNASGGVYQSGSEIVVLGWDTTDTHPVEDNFWQELASITLGVPADEMDTGTIPAKKYLWVQAFVNGSGAQDNTSFRFNGDTGNNYAWRNSSDGAADTTVINYNYLRTAQEDKENSFSNTFIVNNSANEKLLICDTVKYTTAGAGTAANRNEMAGKWTNTSSQITQIKYIQFGAGDMDTGSTLKVWGHD